MKKLILIVLVLSLLLPISSCNEKVEVSESPSPTPVVTPTPLPSDLPIYTGPKDDGTINLYISEYPFFHMFDEDKDAWEEYIMSKYQVPVNLEYITYNYNYQDNESDWKEYDGGIVLDEIRYLQNLNGFLHLKDIYDITKLKDADLIIPVNDFISEIPCYEGIPSEVFNQYKDEDGNIWALPTNDRVSLPRRIYNEEWLKAYRKGPPTTLDEFYDYAHYIAYGDPDGNGIEDTYITGFKSSDIIRSLQDIFMAFGCYTNGFYPISYNPIEGRYTNVCESEAFSDAITLIYSMVREGLLFEDNKWADSLDNPESLGYKIGSVMGVSYYPEYFDGYVIGDYLQGNDGPPMVQMMGYTGGLVVLKDTQDVAERFNKLFGIAATGNEGFMDLYAGREGYSYEIEEDYINLKTIKSDGGDNPRIGINMGIALPVTGRLPIIISGNIENLELLPSDRFVGEELITENIKFLGTDTVYTAPLVFGIEKLRNIRLHTFSSFYYMVDSIMTSSNSIPMAIRSYNQKLSDEGVYEMLDEINSAFE